MSDPRYLLVADEAAIRYLLIDLKERRVVHTCPTNLWHILCGFIEPSAAAGTDINAVVEPSDEQVTLFAYPEPPPQHIDVG